MKLPRGLLLAIAGLVAALAGSAVSLAVTTLLHARANPIEQVAELVIARTPGPVAESLISVVGRNDKPLLVAGVTLGVLALGALAGVLSGRRILYGNLIIIAMAVFALIAARSRPGFSPTSILPLAAGTATWLIVLGLLVDAVPRADVPSADVPRADVPSADVRRPDASRGAARRDDETTVGPSRRGFLLRAGSVAALAVLVSAGGQLLGRSTRAVETSRRLLRLPVTSGRVPAGANVGLSGVQSWRVPNQDFYRIDTALVVPAVDPNSWRLRIHGMVDREITLTYRDLLDRRLTEDWVTICCVSNPVGGELIGNAWWSGVRLADLLAEAGVQGGADAVKQTSHDGWTCGTPLAALTDGRNAMLAIAMNGEPLPIEHGFPVRTIVPGLYGFVSACKWVVDLEVTTYDTFTAYWTDRGWSVKAPVKTESRIDVPSSGADVKAGAVRVGGSAWAQHTGIAKVEFQVDGHAWQEAELGRVPNDDTWVQWAGRIQVDPGDHTLAVRATDKSGYTQTPVQVDVVPNGATGWDKVDFTAG